MNGPTTKPTGKFAVADRVLRAYAMSKPGATEHFPWGERAIKVKNRVFLFMGGDEYAWGVSCKLAQTARVALMLPFAEPTSAGLGPSGWVTARFEDGDTPPVAMLKEWIDESYLAVATKKTPPRKRTKAATKTKTAATTKTKTKSKR